MMATDAQLHLKADPDLASSSSQLPIVSSFSLQPSDQPSKSQIDAELDDDSDDDGISKYRLTVRHDQATRTPTVRRRQRDAAFQQWIAESQRSKMANNSQSRQIQLERVSTASMIETNENKRIITSPRQYQIELFERAKQKNLIIVLDTGSGKTLIAALLLRYTLDQELERRSTGQPAKAAFFLVDKVALCFQQYSVLKANLEHSIARFHGDMAGVMRTKAFWEKQLTDNMVLVCTAQVLLDCLNNGFVNISQINLLIFDEAHHAKKNHPYARIIKDHYLRELHDRPRILGMTASPVDSQSRDLHAAASELEATLFSEIATVSDEVLAESQSRRGQHEVSEFYDRLLSPEDARTPLWKQIAALSLDQYQTHLDATQDAASSLGAWCADRYWELLITDTETVRRTARAHESKAIPSSDGKIQADRVQETLRRVQKMVRENASLGLQEGRGFSSKFMTLRQILEHAFSTGRAQRCIVFVQKRHTAFLLADAFRHPHQQIRGVRASYLVGCQKSSTNLASMTFRDQVLTLQRFRRGETNCVFSTQVAEEGIDIPECDLIIRFDLYDSAIQYIQSKGRARQVKSTYISMLEAGNMQHLRRFRQATRDANALRRFCSSLPENRKVQDNIVDLSSLAEWEMLSQKVYEIKETGARLTFTSSMEVLAKFTASMCNDASMVTVPEYIVTFSFAQKKFIAIVILPETCPIKSMSGFSQRNKQLAKFSVAFEACVDLIKKKYINGHLQPALARRLPAMRNARLALSSNKRAEYAMRVKPNIWSPCRSEPPTTALFQTLLTLDGPDAIGRPANPILLLTRHPLPPLKPTLLYFDGARSSYAQFKNLTPLTVSAAELELLAKFTLTVFADVFSKEYSAVAEEVPYFLAPVRANGETVCVDWDVAQEASRSEKLEWRDASDEFFRDKLVMDLWDGSRKFIINGINTSLKPSDPVPAGVPMPKSRAYKLSDQTIKEYSNSLTKKSRIRSNWREDQPVVNAELLPLRRNFLDETDAEVQKQDLRCWLILEPLKISRLPLGIVSMALIVPVMMYRLDSTLIALEACQMLDLDIEPGLALEALTKDSGNTDEHGKEQMDFQMGMGRNYERLEFLGDSFLKMATTIALFTLMPSKDEFDYHVERMILVCNQNLFNHAVDRKLQEYVRSKSFDRRTWYPNLELHRGKRQKLEDWHSLSDKSIADVCEALIGAAYMSGKDGNMNMAVKAVTKMVCSKAHKFDRFSEYYKAFRLPSWQSAPASAAQRAAVAAVFKTTGYRFQWPNLLRSAFKHPSYPYEPIPSYQRLEFLGDALLDLVVVDYLFRKFPRADPHWLTEHKMVLVSNHFYGYLCVQLDLHRHLLATTSAPIGQVSDYASELEQTRVAATEAPDSGGDGAEVELTPHTFWLATSPPPKALSDMLEAVVGAMFVDSEYDYGVVRRFFATFIQPHCENMALYDSYTSNHPITVLARLLQENMGCHDWRLYAAPVPCTLDSGAAALTEEDAVCALMVHGQAVENAASKTGREAKLLVAKMMIQRLQGVNRERFRAEVGCDCG